MNEGHARSLELLERRVASIPDALRAAAAIDLAPIVDAASTPRRWIATGTGGSEGPARIFVQALSQTGQCARFEPLSAFLDSPVQPDDALVVFSQGVSPNARLALAHSQRASLCLLVSATAADPSAPAESPAGAVTRLLGQGGRLLHHGPAAESGLLVRVVGPAVATLLALRLALALAGESDTPWPDAVPAAVSEATARASAVLGVGEHRGQIALVHAGGGEACAHGIRWKLLECLGAGDPPSWDVLQLAHGPLQQFYQRPLTVLGLEHEGQEDLFDRLAKVLPRRHHLLRLSARLPPPFGWFEHDALADALVLGELRRTPRNLMDWPGKDADAPLYELGR